MSPHRDGDGPPSPAPLVALRELAPVDLLTACIWAEARGEPRAGQVGVANVVCDRAALSGRSIPDIILAPAQFSWTHPSDPNFSAVERVVTAPSLPPDDWMDAAEIARSALAGTLPDVTDGADHYANLDAIRAAHGGNLPAWIEDAIHAKCVTVKIGHHTFFRIHPRHG